MRTGISFTVSASDQKRLERVIKDPKSLQKHVWRARIVVASGSGLGTSAIMAATGKSKTCVWRWQERFMAEGVDGLLYDKTRPPGTPPIEAHRAQAIVALTLKPPPHYASLRVVAFSASAQQLPAPDEPRSVACREGVSCHTTGHRPLRP